MKVLSYPIVDCDQHYYESDDCFTRHIEAKFKDKTIWVDREGSDSLGRMMLGKERLRFMSVMPGDFIGPPGMLKTFFKGETEEGGAVNINPISAKDYPAYTNRDKRIALMDEQNVEAIIMLPTLGVAIESHLRTVADVIYPTLRSFNRWIAEEWGWGSDRRIHSVAVMSLFDLSSALEELERLIKEDCKLVHLTCGPIEGRSPADEYYDPFWARVEEAGVVIAFHIGETPFNEIYAAAWGEPANPPIHRFTALNTYFGMGARTISDQIAVLIYHNLFSRFPKLRIAVIEFGAAWVDYLLESLDKIYRLGDHKTRWRYGKPEKPSEVFRRHFWVVPFHEDSIPDLVHRIGEDRVINGSDFPHPEGLAWPAEMVEECKGMNTEVERKIMQLNGRELLGLM